MLHTTCSRDRSCFCSLICFKTFRSRAGRIKVPNSPRKTSSYQLPTAWCANTPAIQASTKNRTEDITSTSSGSHQQGRVLGRNCICCWAFHEQKWVWKNLFQGFDFCLQRPAKTWHRDLTTCWRTISLPDETKLEKSNTFVYFFFFLIDQLHNPFFVFSLGEKVLLTFLLAWREGRRKYTYIKKVKTQTHRFICWSSHSALSFSKQLLVYYQYLISI